MTSANFIQGISRLLDLSTSQVWYVTDVFDAFTHPSQSKTKEGGGMIQQTPLNADICAREDK